jgi:hypothetical protein
MVKKNIEMELEDMIGSNTKSFMANYAALHHSLIAIAKTSSATIMSDCYNKVIAVILHEVGLVSVSDEELVPYDDHEACFELIDEKVRIVKAMLHLFYRKLLDDKTVEEFEEQIDLVAQALRKRLLAKSEHEKAIH